MKSLKYGDWIRGAQYGWGWSGLFVRLKFFHATCGAFAPILPGDRTNCYVVVLRDGHECEYPIDTVHA